MSDEMLVRWRMKGSLVRNGIAQMRTAGDEDIVGQREARRLSVCGLVEVVGTVAGLHKARSLQDSLKESKEKVKKRRSYRRKKTEGKHESG